MLITFNRTFISSPLIKNNLIYKNIMQIINIELLFIYKLSVLYLILIIKTNLF